MNLGERPGRTAILLILAVALLAAAERGLRVLRGRAGGETGGARWIWDPAAPAGDGGLTFFAVRDFELDRPPAAARLLAAIDEEGIAFLNGDQVGSARFRDGGSLAAWEVGSLLRAGRNRLVVEARSGRGVGGLLVLLRAEGDEPRGRLAVGSGGAWRIFREFDAALFDPDADLAAGEPARVWSAPPAGRWRLPPVGATRPLLADLLVGSPLVAGRATVRPPGGGEPRALSRRSRRPGAAITFDWGREVTGYLGIAQAGVEGARALVWAGTRPPSHDPLGREEPTTYLLNPRGRRWWLDTVPRTFRFVTLVGIGGFSGARVFPVDGEGGAVAVAANGGEAAAGVFGLEPPPLRPPVEDEIRRELERLAGRPRR